MDFLQTILFVTHRKRNGFEESAYIDYATSIKRHNTLHPIIPPNDWPAIFAGKASIIPKPHHLSYIDWHTKRVTYNSSENFEVINDLNYGLCFMHKGDHKIVCVEPKFTEFKDNCKRTMYYSKRMGYVTFFDHVIRKKT